MADGLDGTNRTIPYDDGTFVRMAIHRTSDGAYPSGWRYALHYGARDPEPAIIEFPSMVKLYKRFWREIPKSRADP